VLWVILHCGLTELFDDLNEEETLPSGMAVKSEVALELQLV